MKLFRHALCVAVLCATTSPAWTANIGIITGDFYTPNLNNSLTGAGQTVTEIGGSYNAASLSAYDAVIVYGNMTTADMNELESYASNGGRLIETPWFWLNYSPLASISIFSNGGGASYSEQYPGVSILNGSNDLLSGISFPAGPGGFNIGRTTGNTFAAGVTQVANWADGTAFLGHKSLGSGHVIGINMHVITSDTAYQVIDQQWATDLFVNAANFELNSSTVPEPASMALLGTGLVALVAFARRRSS